MNWFKDRFLRGEGRPARDHYNPFDIADFTDGQIALLAAMPSMKEQREAAIKRACAAGRVVDVVDHNGELVERWVPPGVPVDPRQTIAIGQGRDRVVYGGRRSGKALRARLGQP